MTLRPARFIPEEPEQPTPKPRRKWRIMRWVVVGVILFFAWFEWNAYRLRQAVTEAKALGWNWWHYTPVEVIREDWKAALRNKRWAWMRYLTLPESAEFESHRDLVLRLQPRQMLINNAKGIRDLSMTDGLSRLAILELPFCADLENLNSRHGLQRLKQLSLTFCPKLNNVDALKHLSCMEELWITDCPLLINTEAFKGLSGLQSILLSGCTNLTNVNALKKLPRLKHIVLQGCTGLSPEAVSELKAALPDAIIHFP